MDYACILANGKSLSAWANVGGPGGRTGGGGVRRDDGAYGAARIKFVGEGEPEKSYFIASDVCLCKSADHVERQKTPARIFYGGKVCSVASPSSFLHKLLGAFLRANRFDVLVYDLRTSISRPLETLSTSDNRIFLEWSRFPHISGLDTQSITLKLP